MLATQLSKITSATMVSDRSLDKYNDQWGMMVIRDNMRLQILEDAKLILKYRKQFELATYGTKIPWQFAGIIYYRECTCDFKGHPHNGDSLRRRTVNVPAGRPIKNPASASGYTFVESFADLIQLKGWDKVPVWSIQALLYYFESNNGFGYRRLKVPIMSPYLWSGTEYYTKGKFASDGKYDGRLKDKQIGCAPLFRYLTDHEFGLVTDQFKKTV